MSTSQVASASKIKAEHSLHNNNNHNHNNHRRREFAADDDLHNNEATNHPSASRSSSSSSNNNNNDDKTSAGLSQPLDRRLQWARQQQQRYEHLSKRTRQELAVEEHNYNLRPELWQPAPESHKVASSKPPTPLEATTLTVTANSATATAASATPTTASSQPHDQAQPMDDCMAAMVLMILSSRPADSASVAPAPVPAGTAATVGSNTRQPQQQNEKPAKHNHNNNNNNLLGPCLDSCVLAQRLALVEQQQQREDLQLSSSQHQLAPPLKRNSEPIEMDTSGKRVLYQRHLKRPLFEEHDEDDSLSDEDEEDANEARHHEQLQGSSAGFGAAKRAARQESPEQEMIFELQQVDAVEDKPQPAPAASSTTPATTTTTTTTLMDMNENPVNLCQAESRQLAPLANGATLYTANKQSWFANNHNHTMLHRSPPKQQQQQQPASGSRRLHTIFSCMWPGCTRNLDSLRDIERHVRSHLGPKQCDSTGDEDFYYEETEVDEATYQAIFNHNHSHSHTSSSQHQHHQPPQHQRAPMSPSHNSDGLSSGRSLTSSSPATSPVCSTDGCSSSSSSSASSTCSSVDPSSASQLAASSINWSHFLTGHSQLMRVSSAAGKWLPSGVYLGADSRELASATLATFQLQQPVLSNHQITTTKTTTTTTTTTKRHQLQNYPAPSQLLVDETGGQQQSQRRHLVPSLGARPKSALKRRDQHQPPTPTQPQPQPPQPARAAAGLEKPLDLGTGSVSPVLETGRASHSRNGHNIHQESRKCRKFYGIARRSLWCTQCKWKKACTRFWDPKGGACGKTPTKPAPGAPSTVANARPETATATTTIPTTTTTTKTTTGSKRNSAVSSGVGLNQALANQLRWLQRAPQPPVKHNQQQQQQQQPRQQQQNTQNNNSKQQQQESESMQRLRRCRPLPELALQLR